MINVGAFRNHPVVRRAAQVAIVLLLLAAGWSFNERIDASESTTAAVNGVLARSCGAASFAELRKQGLVEECRLAQAGDLVDAIPDEELPEPNAKPTDVKADVVEDDSTSTPADIKAPEALGPTDDQVAAEVADYFADNPLNTQPGYERAIRRTVAAYLTANPPAAGRPPTEGEIGDAVRAALIANPPEPGQNGSDGANGSDGVSVINTTLDGCSIEFAYSDGTTSKVGPVCGKDGQPGPPPTEAQIAQAVAAYCTSNGECRGPAGPPGVVQVLDNCTPPEGEFVTDVAITGPTGDPATITLSCTSAPSSVIPPAVRR